MTETEIEKTTESDIKRERERERHTHTHTRTQIYIYIYIYILQVLLKTPICTITLIQNEPGCDATEFSESPGLKTHNQINLNVISRILAIRRGFLTFYSGVVN